MGTNKCKLPSKQHLCNSDEVRVSGHCPECQVFKNILWLNHFKSEGLNCNIRVLKEKEREFTNKFEYCKTVQQTIFYVLHRAPKNEILK